MNKKLTGIFAMCALLLTGCQGAKESSKEITPPDTGWGKTVDEVLADWNLDRDQVEIFSETESAAAIAVDTEATVFGEQTSRVMFQFINLDQTVFCGGAIAPGLDMGLGALSERTAQLPRLDLQIPKRIIGRNTEECILSGTIVGMAAMLDGMVQRIEAELGSPATLILTDGAARFVEPLVLHPHIYDPNLLLKGLAFLCERNCAN